MKLTSLIDEVYALGFDTGGGMDAQIISATNRALRQIFCDQPSPRELRLYITPKGAHMICQSFVHRGGEINEFSLSGLAFSFKFSGQGEVCISDENGTRTISFDSPHGTVRDFISGEATLSFSGAFCYSVLSLACFDGIASAKREDIPIADEPFEIKMRDVADDFFFFSRQPTDKNKTPVASAVAEGDRLLIPNSFSGEIIIHYNRAPRACSIDTLSSDIDIPECLCHLLPLLVASYVWLEDDAERASHYWALYREGLSRIRSTARGLIDTTYFDVLRWA